MSGRKTVLMLTLTVIAIVLYALRFVPAVGVSPDLSDFFGGMAIGLGIGTAVTWTSERL